MGKKGKDNEPGFIYLPYIPIMKTPIVVDGDWNPRKTISSRYMTATIDSKYYGKIKIGKVNKNDRDYEDTNFEQWEEE